MLSVLRNRVYRHLFGAQILALTGTGLATVALGLLAFDLAGDQAGLVLGTALTVKMVAYVSVAPVFTALAGHLDRRRVLVALDLVRALAALCLPFVDAVWQIYALIFLLQAASAGFTPTFQATIPEILPDEADYTKALSLSRLAYEFEALISPALAGALLLVMSFDRLFLGTAMGFAASALLVVSVGLPSPRPGAPGPIWQRTTRGMRIYLATPRLRGLLALYVTVAAISAMVIVNTVVLIRARLQLDDSMVAVALAAYGAGAILAAVVLPGLLRRRGERSVMMGGAAMAIAVTFGLGLWSVLGGPVLTGLLAGWALTGFGLSAVMTPTGLLLRRSATSEDRPAVFAAQFTLSHACWLVAYPLAGWLMSWWGAGAAFLGLAALAGAGLAVSARLWPADDPQVLDHRHPDLPADHPHLAGGPPHRHNYVIDDLHRHWPDRSG